MCNLNVNYFVLFIDIINKNNKYIQRVMSQMRDIQKLRHTRGSQQYYGTVAGTNRFSQPNTTTQSSQYSQSQQYNQYQTDFYNINFDKFAEREPSRNNINKFNDMYSKKNTSKELYPRSRERKPHKRNQSNGFVYEPRKESDPIAPGISIYNFTMKLNNRTSNISNPLTSRREHPEISEIQMMPESEANRPKTYNNNKINMIMEQQQQCSHQIGKFISQKTVQDEKISKTSFKILYPVGKGGFGKVWKVQSKKNGEVLAMKQMYKAKIIQKKSINSVMNQRNLLAKLRHPFIINMHAAFQDRENLYLIMDYLDGGDLRYHIGKRRKFTESQTKFFLANIVLGLEYIHKNKIIHRDMKPENMVFDSDGYLRITDMGISRELREDNHQDTSGTPGYMSPEVICRNNHSYPADFFAVGVMGYQFMLGKRPYNGRNRKQIRDQILSKQAMIRQDDIPYKWSIEAADFINRLLQRNPKNRLGFNGIQQIKKHPWMLNIDWERLLKKQIRAPYIPISIEDNYDDYKQQISEDTIDDNLQQNLLMLRDREVQSLFEGYSFNRSESERKRNSHTTTNTQSEIQKF